MSKNGTEPSIVFRDRMRGRMGRPLHPSPDFPS
jgi:hypothetical protein